MSLDYYSYPTTVEHGSSMGVCDLVVVRHCRACSLHQLLTYEYAALGT